MSGSHARLSALGQPAGREQDDAAALPRHHCRPDSRNRHGEARIKVIAGSYKETRGPVTDIFIDPVYLDVSLNGKARFHHPTPAAHTVMLYAIAGSGAAATTPIHNREMILFDSGDEIAVEAGPAGLRFLLLSGKPLREPVAWRGPIVMNTEEELQTAFREYQQGTFIKHR
jgi:redox-sensitive bicupin YhaK (pirin superfamily)